ncbi:MAG: heme-binding protein [Actinomycetota bacterium]|nr:heme-binding protein [Actinomycetota bacterium]
MDGAPWGSADVAQGKAWTAGAYGTPSAAQKNKMAHGKFTPQTGAVPVYRDSALLGAIGASGGTGEQDEAVCTTAVTESGLSTTL